uniref:Arrestin C-terminal-like domain-containing protein n=1 Tax=Kryptolebias marmoratus TaxID=37003 RepID=A0A3Q3AV30_KRYMA
MTVKHFSVEYDRLHEQGTYSPGDVLSGKVTVVTSKEIKVQSFLVRAKGKAKVTWNEQEGQPPAVHSDKKKYFFFKHIILQDKNKGDVFFLLGSEIMGPGTNVYPFSFVIPNRYVLFSDTYHRLLRVVCLSESVSKISHGPQSATRISFAASGKVTMTVTSEKMGLKQGEAMGVFVEVLNESARSVTPKFYVCEKQTFVAQSKKRVHTKDILFGTGDSVPAESSRSTTKVLIIPQHLPATFFNCCMMKLEYRIKVLVPLMGSILLKITFCPCLCVFLCIHFSVPLAKYLMSQYTPSAGRTNPPPSCSPGTAAGAKAG